MLEKILVRQFLVVLFLQIKKKYWKIPYVVTFKTMPMWFNDTLEQTDKHLK